MNLQDAVKYLNAHGETIKPAPAEWMRRGFAFHAQGASQMLTSAQLIEYAENTRSLLTT